MILLFFVFLHCFSLLFWAFPLFSILLFLCLVEVAVSLDQPFKTDLALISHFDLDVSSSLVLWGLNLFEYLASPHRCAFVSATRFDNHHWSDFISDYEVQVVAVHNSQVDLMPRWISLEIRYLRPSCLHA